MKWIQTILLLLCVFPASLIAQDNLIVGNGTQLKVGTSTQLVIHQMDLDNEGIVSAGTNSTVKFTGSGTQNLYSDSNIDFYYLEIDKASSEGLLRLNDHIDIEKSIILSKGRVDLNGYNIILAYDGDIVGENTNHYITGASGGYVEKNNLSFSNVDQYNPGNIGVEITSVADWGPTIIRRGHQAQSSADGGSGIQRYFDIIPTLNTNLNATIRLYYLEHELNGIPEAELECWQSTDDGLTWDLFEGGLLNTTNNWIQLSGINEFALWTLASPSTSPLPAELISFRGEAAGDHNLLRWVTASEDNVDRFIIEKLEGQDWMSVGEVEAVHFSTETQYYHWKDLEVQQDEYYRLLILDYDGATAYSEMVHIGRSDHNATGITIYPNPATDILHVRNTRQGPVDEILVYNTQGQLVQAWHTPSTVIDVSALEAGLYILKVKIGTDWFSQKVTKQ